jgi:hypothetical protein
LTARPCGNPRLLKWRGLQHFKIGFMLFPICMAQVINALHRRIQFFPRHVFQVLSAPCWIKLPPSNVIIRHRSLTPRRGPTFYRHFSRHRLAQLCSDYAPPFRDRVAPPFRRVSVLSGPAGSAHARDEFAPPPLRRQPVLSNGGKCLTVWQVCLVVCTENLIRVDGVMELLKLAE